MELVPTGITNDFLRVDGRVAPSGPGLAAG